MKFIVVVPAYNEEKRIGKILADLKKYSENIVVIDDGSVDKTYLIARNYGISVLRHKINLGKGAALKTGCDYAFNNEADFVVTIDSDGQHDPKKIPDFVKAIENGSQIVFGVRELKKSAPILRRFGNEFASFLIMFIFGIKLPDILCGFRAFTKKAYDEIRWTSVGYGVETEMVARTGKKRLKYNVVSVDTIYIDKYKGVSLIDAIKIPFGIISWRLIK